MEHLLSPGAERLLEFGLAFFWTITYIIMIYKGFRDRTCAVPAAALCANITWEFLFGLLMPFHPLQQVVTVVWLLLDCIILLQLFYYSRSSYASFPLKLAVPSLLIIAFLLHYGMAVEFNDAEGKYSAFGINLMMSLLFIRMVVKQDLLGQSIYIAWFKMIGTLCAAILSYSLFPQSLLLGMMYVLTFILDIVYIVLINNRSTTITIKSRSSLSEIRS